MSGKNYFIRIFPVLFALNIAFSAFSQEIVRIPKDSLLADFDTLFKTIDEIHVNMYACIPEEEFAEMASRVKSKINRDMTPNEFFRIVAPLVSALGDGHTNLYPSFEEFKWRNSLLFPYWVSVDTNDSTVCIRSNPMALPDSIPLGATVNRINGIAIDTIISGMMRMLSGERYFFKLVRVNRFFIPFLNLLYPDSVYTVDYTYNGATGSKRIEAVPFSVLMENMKTSQNKRSAGNTSYTFTIRDRENVGIIDFRHFYNRKRFSRFLDSVFTVMKERNIGNLIIDIRNNGGGNSTLGDDLFQYISHTPFAQFGKTVIKYSDRQKRYILERNRGFWAFPVRWRIRLIPNGLKVYDGEKLIKLRKNRLRYNGNVYLLISHNTFSSAASFSWAFKHFNMGTVIGRESGGMGVCFGDILSFSLPHSKLYYTVSFKKFYQYGATEEDIHGTLPHYTVDPDSALTFTLNLINKGVSGK